MGSNAGGKETMLCENSECSEPTVEIKIKTLDSQTYTLRVDKSVPVPALKEQIATVTGVLSDQQRLICRGKVLKDDQLLSAYLVDVEDGHTLHLVVRQPVPPQSESATDPATDPASGSEHSHANQGGPSVVVGTFNLSEQGDGLFPDFGRIVSAVLGSLVTPSTGSGSEAAGMQESFAERLSRAPGLGGFRIQSVRQADDTATRNQSNSDNNDVFSFTADATQDTLQPPVIPDSLATLSHYLSHMRQEFDGNVRGQVSGSHGSNGQDSSSALRFGLPTPSSLAEVTASTRQLLVEQAAECLRQLTRQLEDQATVTDQVGRTRIQSNALRSGALLQNLGAFLLELGRTTMTLRLGHAPTDAVVNAGPAVFISTSGPNPIMVQPLPFQPGTSFGAAPAGNVQPSHGASVGSGFRPSNVDIRIIRTGSVRSSPVANQRNPTASDSQGQNGPAVSGSGIAAQQAATRQSEARVLPIRTVVTAIPLGRAPVDTSRGSLGILHQVLGRHHHLDSGNGDGSGQASEGSRPQSVENQRQSNPDSQEQNHGIHVVEGTINGQRISTDNHFGFDQLLRTIVYSSEQSNGEGFNFHEMGSNSASSNVESSRNGSNSQETAPRVGDEGTFLASLLRHIIPIVSQNASDTNESSQHTGVPSTEDRENQERGTSSRRPGDDPPSSPSSKRQRRE